MANSKPESEEAISATGVGALRSGTMELVIEEGVTAESCHTLLDRVLDLHGCRACGLAGLDLRWRVQDKLLSEKFTDIPGLRSVSIYR